MERLNATLTKSGDQERMFKEKVTELSISLNETNSSTQSLQEKLQNIQRALTNSEHDRQVLQEKFDALKSQHQEGKRTIEAFKREIQLLRHSVADAEVINDTCLVFVTLGT